jgi:AAA family ATP:ADP antiporter
LEEKTDDAREHAARGPLEKVLSIFADTHPGEGVSAVLLTISVFLLLTSYYLLKTAREPLILESGAEIKSYSSAGQALLLIPATYLYGRLAQGVGRIKLITVVTLVFASNLFVFFGLHVIGVPIGVAFFLWVGVFNMMIVAQFWSFAADVYTEAQGKRLFAILGIGSTVGAVSGSALASRLVHPVGVHGLMLAAVVFLLASLAFTIVVHRREKRASEGRASAEHDAKGGRGAADAADAPLGKKGGFALLLADRYLLLIAALALLLNCVNSNGEYILDRTLLQHVKDILPAGADAHAFKEEYIGEFKAHYFLYVNSATVIIQLFAVSRIIKYLGVRVALFIAPIVSLAGYSTLVFLPVLGVIFAVKISENTLDYSVQNTSRQALWLITSRDEKYKAKSVIDAFVTRCGDFLSAGVTMVGVALSFATVHFIMVNVVLVGGWLTVVVLLARQHEKREASGSTATTSPPERERPAFLRTRDASAE